MAISILEFRFLYYALSEGLIPPGGSILEFGEAHIHELDVPAALRHAMPEGTERDRACAAAAELMTQPGNGNALAKLIYRAVFKYSAYTAIDLEPGQNRIQQDLNQPFDLGTRYDVCINNGTSEHVFNQANVYKAIHDHTRAGGLMFHWTPCLGWFNHGLFNIQPGLIFDLARANDYDVRLAVLATDVANYPMKPGMQLSNKWLDERPDLRNAMAFSILRKKSDRPFAYPIQGAYRYLESELRGSP